MDLYQVAEIELSYQRNVKTTDRPKVTHATDAHKILIDRWDKNKLDFIEQAKILLLNKAGYALGICHISSGGLAGTFMDTRMIFAAALKANAASIILAHNHPSANIYPSSTDRKTTEQMMAGGKLLDVPVLDHLIITSEAFYSMAEQQAYQAVQIGHGIHYELLPPF